MFAPTMAHEHQFSEMADRARAFEVHLRRRVEELVLELDHDAWELRDLIVRHGGVGAAKRSLDARNISRTFRFLRRHRRLDLTVVSLALDHRWSPLFTAQQLERAAERLMRAQIGQEAA